MNKRALIVEEDESVAKITGRIFEKLGYKTDVVHTQNEGIHQARQLHYDVFVLDMRMKDPINYTGNVKKQYATHFADRIHKEGLRNGSLLYIQTGALSSEGVKEMDKFNPSGYIQKPFGLDQWRSALEIGKL